MDQNDYRAIADLLSEGPKNIVIVTHKNPDGDAIGSSLGLWHLLEGAGHTCQVITPNDYPGFLKWLPGDKSVWRYEWTRAKSARAIAAADVIFCLDFNDITRIDALGEEVAKSPAMRILIDHHIAPAIEARYVYSDTRRIATSEMVYLFAEQTGLLPYLNCQAATCLYTGILTDSGQFAFPKTSALTHRIVAELLDRGVDNYETYRHVYMNFTPSRLMLLGTALSNLHFYHECAAVCMTLDQDELNRGGFHKGDTEGFVNYGLTVRGVNLSCILVENRSEGIIKVSLRSKGRFSVNDMARKYFFGGGHLNAAGGQLPFTDMERAVALFSQAAEHYRDDILASLEEPDPECETQH